MFLPLTETIDLRNDNTDGLLSFSLEKDFWFYILDSDVFHK